MLKLTDDRIPFARQHGICLGHLTQEQEDKMLEFVKNNGGKILIMSDQAAEDMIKKEIGK
jgi:hypothetical protein